VFISWPLLLSCARTGPKDSAVRERVLPACSPAVFGRGARSPLPSSRAARCPRCELPDEAASSLIPCSLWFSQADEPIADYAAMDDVMQGEAGGDAHREGFGVWGGAGGQGLGRIWGVKVENGDVGGSLRLPAGGWALRRRAGVRSFWKRLLTPRLSLSGPSLYARRGL